MNDARCATTSTIAIAIGTHSTICQTDPAPMIQADDEQRRADADQAPQELPREAMKWGHRHC